MDTFKKVVCGLFFLFLSFVIVDISFASLSPHDGKLVVNGKGKTTELFFAAAVDNATIKPVGGSNYQIYFHKIRDITYISLAPEKIAGNMSPDKFVREIWTDKSKLNASIIAAFSTGEKKKTYVFQLNNPRYNAANGDFVVDAESFSGKKLPAFKSQQEVKISDIALWIDSVGVNEEAIMEGSSKVNDWWHL